ncbi:MAG: helix-turn-helix domain-containing protein [Dehalococcoidia bacterium]
MNELFDGERVYTVSEVASALRVSPVTLVRAIHKGKLRAFRVEGQWRILGREAMRYLYKETERTLTGRLSRPPD